MVRSRGVLLLILLLAGTLRPGWALEGVWDEEENLGDRYRIRELVRELDVLPRMRLRYVLALAEELQGENRELALTMLRATMEGHNLQVKLGVIEALSRVPDPEFLPDFRWRILFDPSSDVRVSALRHLPAFCMPDPDERNAMLAIVESDFYAIPDWLQGRMRQPPLDRDAGLYIPARDRMRQQVEALIATQLDPVEAVIQQLETRRHRTAIESLRHLLDLNLGHARDGWLEFWQAQGQIHVATQQGAIEEFQIAASVILQNLGAEGTPYLVDRLRWLAGTQSPAARQAALETTAVLAEYAGDQLPVQRAALEAVGADTMSEAERGWRRRRMEAHERMLALAHELGTRHALAREATICAAAIHCLGAGRTPDAVRLILEAGRMGGDSEMVLRQQIRSLGAIGSVEAVAELARLSVFRGVALDRFEQVQDYGRVEEAMQALAQIVRRARGPAEDLMRPPLEAGEAAFAVLLERLADSRAMAGAPSGAGHAEGTVRILARRQLQYALGVREPSFDPAVWRRLYAGE